MIANAVLHVLPLSLVFIPLFWYQPPFFRDAFLAGFIKEGRRRALLPAVPFDDSCCVLAVFVLWPALVGIPVLNTRLKSEADCIHIQGEADCIHIRALASFTRRGGHIIVG